MPNERGFTVSEMVAAVFVLSLAMVSLGSVTNLLVRGWNHIEASHQLVTDRGDIVAQLHKTEGKLRSSLTFYDQPVLELDNAPDLILATPKIDRPASCEFDLVGRRCR